MSKPFFKLNIGDGPLIVTALHNGNYIREDLKPYLAIDENTRFYEEDPFTGFFVDLAETNLVGMHSRFEIDLNRKKNKAIYKRPEQAWGLNVWKELPSDELLEKSYQNYDNFYRQAEAIITNKILKYGFAIVYDIHSYNYKRDGKEGSAHENPDINIGTNGLNRTYWNPVVEGFINHLKSAEVSGERLDIRENVKFRGGNFSTWINQGFDNKACALAIEIKKTFMDELTNELHMEVLSEIKKAIETTIPEVIHQGTLLFGEKQKSSLKN